MVITGDLKVKNSRPKISNTSLGLTFSPEDESSRK